jgi:hypothetical protein
MSKIYAGARRDGLVGVTVTDEQGTRLLEPRLDLVNHSPNGFEWGYGGSGPAQLALAICADLLDDDERADRVHQDFKWRMIAPIRSDEWELTEWTVRCAIERTESDTK